MTWNGNEPLTMKITAFGRLFAVSCAIGLVVTEVESNSFADAHLRVRAQPFTAPECSVRGRSLAARLRRPGASQPCPRWYRLE
jgi:hypothetical protein